MSTLKKLINSSKWHDIYIKYQHNQVLDELSFEECMHLAYQIFNNKEVDDDLMNYAVDLLQLIRQKHPASWNFDWRNDLFLGDVCHWTMRFDDRYKAYKRASMKFKSDLPPSLLVSLAMCYSTPEKSPISIYEAENLATKAFEKEKSIESVTLIRGICGTQGREAEFLYWDKILKELEKKGAYMKNEWPKNWPCS